jgi:hypothetical protein
MYLDKQYIHKKPKDHIILNGRSIMLYKQPTAEMIYRSNPRPWLAKIPWSFDVCRKNHMIWTVTKLEKITQLIDLYRSLYFFTGMRKRTPPVRFTR